MDKLLNIGRQGGYPLCTETLQVLYDNARAVNVLLAGLGLPNKTAVILGAESGATAAGGYRYLYVVTVGNRRLVRYDLGSGVSTSDLSSAKVSVAETAKDVHDNNDNTIAGVYSEERAVIEHADNASERWTFYRLKDVLEPAIYRDLLPEFRTQIANTNVSLDEGYGNILRVNENKLRVKLKVTRFIGQHLVGYDKNSAIDIPNIPNIPSGTYPLNAIVLIDGRWRSMAASLSNGTMSLGFGQAFAQANGVNSGLISGEVTVIINSEVVL